MINHDFQIPIEIGGAPHPPDRLQYTKTALALVKSLEYGTLVLLMFLLFVKNLRSQLISWSIASIGKVYIVMISLKLLLLLDFIYS